VYNQTKQKLLLTTAIYQSNRVRITQV